MRPRPLQALLGVSLALAPTLAATAQDATPTDAGTTIDTGTTIETPAAPAVIVIELVPASPATIEAPATVYAPAPPSSDGGASAEADEDAYDETPQRRSFAIGLSGLVGLRDAGEGVMPTWSAGLDLAFHVLPWARVAVRRIGYGMAETLQGERHAISASPAIDLFVPLGDLLEPFAELGALVQARFGEGDTRVGVAPFAGGGLRILATDWLVLEVEGALHVPATTHVLVGHELFPTASLLLQLGVGAEARF